MPAEEFARRRRQKALKWGAAGTAVALLLGIVLYWFSLPAAAQNAYIDAKKLFDSGKYADALEAANRASRARSQRLAAYQLRAAIFQAMHQPEDALVDIGRVIDLQPGVPGNYRIRAQMYLDAGNLQKALEDYSRLIEMENSATAYNGRGICYMRLNQPARAIDDFAKAIERDPSVESYLQRGLARASMGDHRAAVADLDRAVELGPLVSATYRARANSRAQLGDAQGAASDREKALALEKPPPPKIEQVSVPEHP